MRSRLLLLPPSRAHDARKNIAALRRKRVPWMCETSARLYVRPVAPIVWGSRMRNALKQQSRIAAIGMCRDLNKLPQELEDDPPLECKCATLENTLM